MLLVSRRSGDSELITGSNSGLPMLIGPLITLESISGLDIADGGRFVNGGRPGDVGGRGPG